MTARVLDCANLIAETSKQRDELRLSLEFADQLLWQWQSDPLRWQSLLHQVFGRSEAVDLTGITIEILAGQTMADLYGAYAPIGADGEERIYLNGDWLETASAESIQAILLEEVGHAIDHRLNGDKDTTGDEGAIFSALVRGVAIPPVETNQNDHHTLIINGQRIPVEAAAPTLTASASLQSIANVDDPAPAP